MWRKLMCGLLAWCVVMAVAVPVHARSNPKKQAKFAEKIRVGITSLGIGEDTRVEVKLRDKTKLRGFIQAADESGFVVADLRTGALTPVAYRDVAKVKGHNLSTGAKIGIGIAIGAGIVILTLFILWHAMGDS